jgi:hypothetical protein
MELSVVMSQRWDSDIEEHCAKKRWFLLKVISVTLTRTFCHCCTSVKIYCYYSYCKMPWELN